MKVKCFFLLLIVFLTGPLAINEVVATPPPTVEDKIAWYDASCWSVGGKGWQDTSTPFTRLPQRAQETVPKPVWTLAQHSAGLVVYFRTDASTIRARHEVGGNLTMPHMTTVGSSGLDLYARDEKGQWHWAGFSKPDGKNYDQALLSGAVPEVRDYMLYLPLYNNTVSLSIGVPEGSRFEVLKPPKEKPILYYGTSIAHGCSASRPGMAFPAILGRRLDRPVINFGFSGNGRMEAEMADLIAEIDAAVFVLDCVPNMTLDHVKNNTEIFIRKLRKARPETPIVMVEDRTLTNAWLLKWWQENHRNKREAYRAVYDKLTKEGMTGLIYLSADHLLGDDDEGTVDGSHPTDLGMVRMADAVEPVLREALSEPK